MIDQAADAIRRRLAPDIRPTVGIVLGSGLGSLASNIANPTVIPYSEIPHFRQSTAVGHVGNLIVGSLGGHTVVAMQGRLHYYEGYSPNDVTFPIRVMARLGIAALMVSNAAGGVNPNFSVGDLMVITDHINLIPNPLIGPNLDEMGPRFPDMTEAYSRRLRTIALEQAAKMGLALQQGVYLASTGPTYETPAEYRMYGRLGADAVGMSTVPEVIVARHCGIEVFGMSIITNAAKDLGPDCLNDTNDVLQQAERATKSLSTLFEHIIAQL